MEIESEQKGIIEKIRREKFSIGAEIPNTLAATLHEAIRHLSAELYQKDIHFISELVQNAEDNSYEEGVEPELDLVLTRTDVTGVGAPATLIFFNNELGFRDDNISALCSVGQSTKKGQRNEGYIGEKGIGFKSVFVVTSTPYVISKGFRIRFSDSGEEATGLGYIVPKWVERPTDDELRCFLRPAAGASSERSLPNTIIVLPLQPQKVASVEAELKQISPETILFLRRITRLRIREETGGKVHQEVIVSRSDSQRVSHGDDATGFLTTLSVVKGPGLIIEPRDYFVWEQRFDVFAPVEQRKEVKTWVITLAFPHQDRIAGGSPGSVYAFLPSQLNSGLRFLINADFLLVSSGETLKFDSPWNQGILSCVATAFCRAMGSLLRIRRPDGECTSSSRIAAPHVYKYVPVKACHAHLGSVQEKILSGLGQQDSILVATNVGSRIRGLCNPSMSRRVDERFREILERAFKENNVSTAISNSNYFVVERSVQANYPEVLDQLGVTWMQSSEYLQILSDSNWLLRLSEDLYLEVLAFISALPSVRTSTEALADLRTSINSVELVKYDDSSVTKLISVDKIKESKMALYISPPQQGSHLSKWVERFGPWIVYRFMSQKTVIAMDKAGTTHEGVKWLKLKGTASVREIDVESFALELVERCTKEQDPKSQPPIIAANFLLLVWRFVYRSVHEGRLKGSPRETRYREFAVVDESGHVHWINPVNVKGASTGPLVLLPRSCSKWPLLLKDGAWSDHAAVIRLSDDYLNLLDNSQSGEYELESCKVFLQDTFGASDLPDLSLPDVPFPELASLSSEQSRWLLQWLNRLRERTTDTLVMCNKFWSSLKTTAWLRTEQHGLQCPEMCFLPMDDLKKFFQPSEVPFVDESFYGDVNPYAEILHKLGVVHCCKTGCVALAKQIRVLRNRAGTSMKKEQMIKFYNYLRIYKEYSQPTFDGAGMDIFIPSETGSQPSWQGPQGCVIEDPENLCRGVLPVLRDIYPEYLLSFFDKVLGVPRTVTPEKCLYLWICWRENRVQYSSEQCAQLWEKIAVSWNFFQSSEKQKFKNKASVLTQTNSGELQITSPDSAFIPDDLQLRSVFMTQSSKLLFVWYPKGSSNIEAELNEMYADLGVKMLSDCVKTVADIDVKTVSRCSTNATPKFITPGLLVAILGFISNSELAISSKRRQSIIMQLCGSAEKEMANPCRIVYKMSSSASAVTAVEDQLFGIYDGRVIHRLADTHELLTDTGATNVRKMETQVLESVCSKILPDCPTMARSLVDFLKLLVGSRFDEAAVEYELRRKNLKLYSEDLDFLEKATIPFIVNLRVFQSLQLL